jgi:S-sulfosulfanyl-L-cysteine sulfohydrolase
MSSLSRREFLQSLAYAGAAGLNLVGCTANGALNSSGAGERGLYDLPSFGNVSVLHFTDCHAQLMPMYFREPNVNLGVGLATGRAPHLVGEHLLKAFGVRAGSAKAYAFTHLNFEAAAQRYGKVGGFAHLATLVKRLKANRPGALLLDGGDTWQGSATALWSKGQDMVEACLLMGVDLMTGHWEFTHGDQRVKEIVDGAFKGKVEFIAQNIVTKDFEDAVFASHVMRHINGVKVAIIGQAFPYTPIANPRYFTPDWSFGIREEQMQHLITRCRSEGAKAVILLSHNGMDVDLKLASRVSGLDAILGGHTHDAVPEPMLVNNPGGKTLVANSGSNGKFLSVLDLDVKADGVSDFRYRLLPVFSNLLPADVEMQALIDRVRAPFKARLDEPLATTEGLLYRRGNFSGSFDQLILDALMEVKDAPIAFSPGFRWGPAFCLGSPSRGSMSWTKPQSPTLK